MDPFRAAVEAKDYAAVTALMAENIEFHSPVSFRPFVGLDSVPGVLEAAITTFEDFEYTDELHEGNVVTLLFNARVGEKKVQGIDIVRYNTAGEIEHFTVMLRPLSGVIAMAEAMGPKVAHLAKGDAPG